MSMAVKHELFVRLGARKYRVERPWGELPRHVPVGLFSAVATDSKDRVFVFQRFDPLAHGGPAPPIHVFEPDGTYAGSWGDGEIADAHHIFIDAADRVFLVDRDMHEIAVFNTVGRKLFTLGQRGEPDAPFKHPASVAVAPSGEIYVADGYGGTEVHRFSAPGELIQTWGGIGREPGRFTTPHGIWVTSDSRVFVGDREAGRVQIFSPDGIYQSELNGLVNPMCIFGDAADNIFVSDQVPRLVSFNSSGEREGSCRPVCNGAHGLWGDSKGNFYLAEMHPNQIVRLTLI